MMLTSGDKSCFTKGTEIIMEQNINQRKIKKMFLFFNP